MTHYTSRQARTLQRRLPTWVLPLTRTRSGKRPNRLQEGVGGGGGAIASPVGFIEIRAGRASVHRIPS
jgi:hypothetical protein